MLGTEPNINKIISKAQSHTANLHATGHKTILTPVQIFESIRCGTSNGTAILQTQSIVALAQAYGNAD